MKHLTATLLLVLAATAAAAPALADGSARRTAYRDDGRPAISWAGYHIGVQAGASFWNNEHQFPGGVDSGEFDLSGGFVGAYWGSTWQRGSMVYGFESDISLGDTDAREAGPGCGAAGCFTDVRYFGTSRVRLGYAMDRTLIYATGGLAYASVQAGNTTDRDTKTRYGWTLGAGIEWMFAPQWSAKLEYQHLEFGDDRNYSTTGGVDVGLDADIVRIGVSRKIDLPFLPKL